MTAPDSSVLFLMLSKQDKYSRLHKPRSKAKRLSLVEIFPSEIAITVSKLKYPAIVRLGSGPTVIDKKRGKNWKMSSPLCEIAAPL